MRPFSTTTIVLLTLFASRGYAGGVAELLDQISRERYTDELRNRLFTQPGSNRDALTAGPERDSARDYIASRFQNYGLETTLDAFTFLRGPNQPTPGTFFGVKWSQRGWWKGGISRIRYGTVLSLPRVG